MDGLLVLASLALLDPALTRARVRAVDRVAFGAGRGCLAPLRRRPRSSRADRERGPLSR